MTTKNGTKNGITNGTNGTNGGNTNNDGKVAKVEIQPLPVLDVALTVLAVGDWYSKLSTDKDAKGKLVHSNPHAATVRVARERMGLDESARLPDEVWKAIGVASKAVTAKTVASHFNDTINFSGKVTPRFAPDGILDAGGDFYNEVTGKAVKTLSLAEQAKAAQAVAESYRDAAKKMSERMQKQWTFYASEEAERLKVIAGACKLRSQFGDAVKVAAKLPSNPAMGTISFSGPLADLVARQDKMLAESAAESKRLLESLDAKMEASRRLAKAAKEKEEAEKAATEKARLEKEANARLEKLKVKTEAQIAKRLARLKANKTGYKLQKPVGSKRK